MINPETNPEHPGILLREQILKTYDLTVTDAAKLLGIHRVSLSFVLNGTCGITPDLCQRLAIVFKEDPEKWAILQAKHDVKEAGKKIETLKLKPFQS